MGAAELGSSGSGFLIRLWSRLGLQSFEDLTEARSSFQNSSLTWQTAGGSWPEGSVSCHVGLSVRLLKWPHHMAAGFLQSE